jgi:hypothetical protein
MMAACDAKTVLSTWEVPDKKAVEDWLASLKEAAFQVEDDMVHPTKNDKEEFLAARANEQKKAARPRAAKGAGKGELIGSQAKEQATALGTSGESRTQENAEEHASEEDRARESEEEEE